MGISQDRDVDGGPGLWNALVSVLCREDSCSGAHSSEVHCPPRLPPHPPPKQLPWDPEVSVHSTQEDEVKGKGCEDPDAGSGLFGQRVLGFGV